MWPLESASAGACDCAMAAAMSGEASEASDGSGRTGAGSRLTAYEASDDMSFDPVLMLSNAMMERESVTSSE